MIAVNSLTIAHCGYRKALVVSWLGLEVADPAKWTHAWHSVAETEDL